MKTERPPKRPSSCPSWASFSHDCFSVHGAPSQTTFQFEVSAHLESAGLVYRVLVKHPSSVRWPSFWEARLNRLPGKWIPCAIVEFADLRAVVSILSSDECRAASETGLSVSTAYFMASAEVGNRRYVMWLPPDGPRPLPMNNSAGAVQSKSVTAEFPLGRQLGDLCIGAKSKRVEACMG